MSRRDDEGQGPRNVASKPIGFRLADGGMLSGEEVSIRID